MPRLRVEFLIMKNNLHLLLKKINSKVENALIQIDPASECKVCQKVKKRLDGLLFEDLAELYNYLNEQGKVKEKS